jgi:hypothetical protein
MGPAAKTRVAAYVPDLIDRSKVAALGHVTFVDDPARLAETDADVVVVDLSRPGVLDVLPKVRARTVGFGRHTATALLQAARDAGCDEVLARSELFARLARGTLAP